MKSLSRVRGGRRSNVNGGEATEQVEGVGGGNGPLRTYGGE